MNFGVHIPRGAHHVRAQCFGEHVHFVNIQLHQLMIPQRFAGAFFFFGELHRVFGGGVANAQCVGGEFEVAELGGDATANLLPLVRFAHHVGVRHTCVFKYQFGVLIEAPARFVEHLADAKARRAQRHHEHRGAFARQHAGVGTRVDKKQFSHRAIGDKGFFAIEYPVVAFAF